MVAYWNLDETSGNTFSDFTDVNNGTGNLSPAPVAGQVVVPSSLMEALQR